MDLTVMHINKGNAHGTQGERSNPANSNEYRLLRKVLRKHMDSSFSRLQSFWF